MSDIHLHSGEGARFAGFAACLAVEARWAEDVFILGDLFEAWPGDDDYSQPAERICAALRQAATAAKLWFMPGNRDFLCGDAFAARTGAALIQDPFITADNLILAHGDTLCTDDAAYQALRKTLRSPAWQAEMLVRPLAERLEAAAEMRRASTTAKANKAEAITDANAAAAAKLLDAHGAQVLIHGHTHRPAIHRCAHRTRYVLGEWAHCGWLLRQTGARFQLECFNLAQPYPKPC